jgi:cyclic pyranopterin monophosphate synthase
MSMDRLSHIASDGSAQMVDISAKALSNRVAIAAGKIRLRPETLELISQDRIAKGNVFAVARIAGIQAAKQTPQLIPLCHNLDLSHVEISFDTMPEGVEAKCTARTTGQTGVEMEALTGMMVALLTIYDMCKAVDKEMRIFDARLVDKTKTSVS